MKRAHVTDADRYQALLESERSALDDLIVELTVGETYFFREPDQFDFIRREVLPDIRCRRGVEHGVRAWSAACASGEEAYSLAILFAEAGLAEPAYLLATDISRATLAKAHQAIFSNWSLRGPGAAAATPYLSRRENFFVLNDRIRRGVTFEYLNLALDVYPSFATGTWGMDLILCRNVLIYFDRETIRAVARRVFASLAPGGWLITASSDPPMTDDAPFESVVTNVGVFYRRPVDDKMTEAHTWPSVVQARGQAPQNSELADRDLMEEGRFLPPILNSAVPDPGRILTPLDEARSAFGGGDYARAAELTRGLTTDAVASVLHVRSLANLEAAQAEQACAAAAERHPLSTELHYLQAVLLLELGRDEEAAWAARRVIYLDRSLAAGHFTLGSILWRRGDVAGAKRAFRNARDLCVARPADEIVPLSEGEHAGRLAEAAAAQIAILDTPNEVLA